MKTANPSVPTFRPGAMLAAWLSWVAAVAPDAAAQSIPPGVPEPGIVIWGQVVNRTNTSQILNIQSAEWSVTDGAKTAVFHRDSRPAVRILRLDGQAYYVMEVPFDTRRMGTVDLSDPATVGLDSFELKVSSPPTYILTPTINGAMALVHRINGAPAAGESLPVSGFSSFSRGRVMRVDLSIVPLQDDYASWAASFFGDPNLPQAARGADPDGDGMTNEQEYEAGTDPTDPDSVLRVLTLTVDPQTEEAVLAWRSVAGKEYIIQTAQEIAGPWADLGSSVVGAGNTSQTQIDVPPGSPRQFYRVRLVP